MCRYGSSIYYCQSSELVLPLVSIIFVRYVFGVGLVRFLAVALALLQSFWLDLGLGFASSVSPWFCPWPCL